MSIDIASYLCLEVGCFCHNLVVTWLARVAHSGEQERNLHSGDQAWVLGEQLTQLRTAQLFAATLSHIGSHCVVLAQCDIQLAQHPCPNICTCCPYLPPCADHQLAMFAANFDLQQVAATPPQTTLLTWMELDKRDAKARQLLYQEIPPFHCCTKRSHHFLYLLLYQAQQLQGRDGSLAAPQAARELRPPRPHVNTAARMWGVPAP